MLCIIKEIHSSTNSFYIEHNDCMLEINEGYVWYVCDFLKTKKELNTIKCSLISFGTLCKNNLNCYYC